MFFVHVWWLPFPLFTILILSLSVIYFFSQHSSRPFHTLIFVFFFLFHVNFLILLWLCFVIYVFQKWFVSVLNIPKNRIEETQDFVGTRDFKDVKHLRILLHGQTGVGKSSFINSVGSALQGRITTLALTDGSIAGPFTQQVRMTPSPTVQLNNFSLVWG